MDRKLSGDSLRRDIGSDIRNGVGKYVHLIETSVSGFKCGLRLLGPCHSTQVHA